MTNRNVEGQPPRTFQDQTGVVHVHHVHTTEPATIPRQLRPAPAHFTDRTQEVAALTRIAAGNPDRRGPAVAVINGQGGVGRARWRCVGCTQSRASTRTDSSTPT